jgi:hypothetical protein
MKTRITEWPGTRYSIVQGERRWVRRAAAFEAGAFAMVTARTRSTPGDLRREIDGGSICASETIYLPRRRYFVMRINRVNGRAKPDTARKHARPVRRADTVIAPAGD